MGKIGGRQDIILNRQECWYKGTVIHEIGASFNQTEIYIAVITNRVNYKRENRRLGMCLVCLIYLKLFFMFSRKMARTKTIIVPQFEIKCRQPKLAS